MPTNDIDRLRPAIHPTYARLLCAHLHQAGFDNAAIFHGTLLQWRQLLAEHRYLSLEQLSRLVRRVVELTGRPWIGLEVDGVTAASAHGSLGYAVVSAPDVRRVVHVVSQFVSLRFQVIGVTVEETGPHCMIRMHEHTDLGDTREFVCAAALATYFQLLDTVTSRRFRDVRIQMPFAPPPWAQVYEDRLGVPVEFDAGVLTITVPRTFLDTPCLTADPVTYRSALRDCEAQLKQRAEGGALSHRISDRLLSCDGDYPMLEELADDFSVSRRTLIRKLKAEGASYQTLLDEVRQELTAWYLLETDLPVERIAEKVGYQDTSNFSRTFRRWFGTTPRAMRATSRQNTIL